MRILRFAVIAAVSLSASMAPMTPASATFVPVYYGVGATFTQSNGVDGVCVSTSCSSTPEFTYTYGYTYYDTTTDTPKPGSCCFSVSWRSGSGQPHYGTSYCTSNTGPIPPTRKGNTYYLNPHYDNYNGTIHGVLWEIVNATFSYTDNATCDNSRTAQRNALFVHSEMTYDRQQTNCSTKFSSTCWTGVIRYESEGCVKLSFYDDFRNVGGTPPGASGTWDWYYHNRGGTAPHSSHGVPFTVND